MRGAESKHQTIPLLVGMQDQLEYRGLDQDGSFSPQIIWINPHLMSIVYCSPTPSALSSNLVGSPVKTDTIPNEWIACPWQSVLELPLTLSISEDCEILSQFHLQL
jgi:hypothetical protein